MERKFWILEGLHIFVSSSATYAFLEKVHSIRATRNQQRLFEQVGHETMFASSGNKHFFLLNHVIVRLIEIINNLLKPHKILILKVIFLCQKWSTSFQTDQHWTGKKVRKKGFNWSEVHFYRSNFLQNWYFRRPTFIEKSFLKIRFLKYLSFLKCVQFLLTLFIILLCLTMRWFSDKCLFPLYAYMVSCPSRTKNLEQALKATCLALLLHLKDKSLMQCS